MQDLIQRSHQLKQELTDFVLDAEGDLAVALERFSADQLARAQNQTFNSQSMVIDRFLVEGEINDQTPIDVFAKTQVDLSDADRRLLEQWKQGFVGLFAIQQVLPDGFELMNWLTTKPYTVRLMAQPQQDVARLKEGEILLAHLVPLNETDWIFFSNWTALGKLGKPKLAVAIGNFKQSYKPYLYSGAPDLLEEAWQSVERYHHEFIDFFGSDEVTLSGYQLSKQLAEFQERIRKKTLEDAGIDPSKSLSELAEDAGISEEELAETAAAAGTDVKTLDKVLTNKNSTQMVAPQIELPPQLKQAEAITALSHPRWGQLFLVSYPQVKALLTEDSDASPISNKTDAKNKSDATPASIVRRALQDPEMNAFTWHRLAAQYPAQLEALLQSALDRPNFKLSQDLDPLLQEFSKPLEPDLPETASVPLHLHQLFQEALLEVNKNKSKGKTKKKTATGF